MTSQPASDIPDPLVQRVRKLLDKAEATTNVHEAEAFSQKAAELVAQHRISPDRLAGTEEADGGLGIIEINIGRGAYVRARLALLTGVAEAHDVRVVFQATPAGTIAFAAGHRSDLGIVEVMYQSLHQQAASQMVGIKRQTGAATQRYRRSFLFGFAIRIGQILADTRSAVEQHLHSQPASTGAVALRERVERVDDFVATSWGRIRSASAPSAVGPDGYDSGKRAAERADVGRARLSGRRAIGKG